MPHPSRLGVAVCIPAYRQTVHMGVVFQMAAMVTYTNVNQLPLFLHFADSGHLDWARNMLLWTALKSGADWCLFSDADTSTTDMPALYRMLADGFGALVVFVLLGFYYAAQRHLPFSLDPGETRRFVAMKKALALVLVAVFTANAGRALLSESPEFFESFYTVLVFADVLIVLLSLRYSPSYAVVFRNSGLAVATVLLRLALSAPAFANAALGVAAAAFALGLTLAYHRVAPVLGREEGRGPREQLAAAPAAGAAQSNPVSPTPSSPG